MTTGKGWSAADQPKSYSTNASFVYSSQYTSPTLALLDPRPGEKILDVGCGSGEVTHGAIFDAVSSSPGHLVVGTDVSESMVSRARDLAGDKPVVYYAVDGHDLTRHPKLAPEQERFDAVFSNAALHWMKKDPAQVVGEVKKMLRPGGRFVAEMGGHLNIIGIRGALHSALKKRGLDPTTIDPWYFPTPEQYSAILTSHGFHVDSIDLVPRPTPLPTGLKGWLAPFAGDFLAPFPAQEREVIVEEVVEHCRIDMCAQDPTGQAEGRWTAMYVRLRFKATLPS